MFCRIACDLPQSTLIYINFPQSTSIYFNFLSIYLNFPQFILLSYLYIPQFTFIYRDLHWFTSIYLILPQFTLIYLILHWFTSINLHLPQFTTFYLKFVISDVFLFWNFSEFFMKISDSSQRSRRILYLAVPGFTRVPTIPQKRGQNSVF